MTIHTKWKLFHFNTFSKINSLFKQNFKNGKQSILLRANNFYLNKIKIDSNLKNLDKEYLSIF